MKTETTAFIRLLFGVKSFGSAKIAGRQCGVQILCKQMLYPVWFRNKGVRPICCRVFDQFSVYKQILPTSHCYKSLACVKTLQADAGGANIWWSRNPVVNICKNDGVTTQADHGRPWQTAKQIEPATSLDDYR